MNFFGLSFALLCALCGFLFNRQVRKERKARFIATITFRRRQIIGANNEPQEIASLLARPTLRSQ
jgi:hypothetical protein